VLRATHKRKNGERDLHMQSGGKKYFR